MIDVLSESLELVSEPIFVVAADLTCPFCNAAFRRLLDLKTRQAFDLKSCWPKLQPSDLRSTHAAAELVLPNGDAYRARVAFHELPGGYRLGRVLAGSSGDKIPDNFQAQRLQTLGLLASGIAHDFNNVLAGILGHISYLKSILPATGKHSESIKAIEEGARKSSLMTQQILSFSKAEAVEKVTRINLCDVVAKTLMLLRGAITPQISIQSRIPAELLTVLAVEARITQVLANLVVNARDAVQGKGTISIIVETVSDSEKLKRIFEGKDLSAGSFAVIEVADDGHGMSNEILERVFEPYFSTKDEKGTGLGLYTVKSIVEFYGGTVRIVSKPGDGTSVSVYWPLIEAAEVEQVAAQELPVLKGGNETVLVVDDESPVRNVLGLSLRHLGYVVEMASSGAEALEIYAEDPKAIDLVVLDMLMPQLSGADVFERVRQLNPDAKILLMSGFASMEVVKKLLNSGAKGFMPKPFTIEELAKKIRDSLDK
ncbi:MAG: response regulator [Oligoflexia bacterium]|nr:response regulator [Oligoflexia bacterium]